MRLTISEARARLAELAHYIMAAPGRMVFIEHRNRKERLVLTSERYIRMLEEQVSRQNKPSFKLAGSLHSELDAEELAAAIAAGRAEAAAAAEIRLNSTRA